MGLKNWCYWRTEQSWAKHVKAPMPRAGHRARPMLDLLEDRFAPAAAFALSGSNLLAFDTATPAIVQTTAIANVTAGETLVGIDFRPQNGLLYGLGVNDAANNATLYAISVRTGFAGVVGTASSIQLTTDGAAIVDLPDPATVGYGFDFNPAADRLRVVAGSLNFRINPNTGAGVDGDNTGLTSGTVNGTNPDGAIVGATSVDAAAYTNNQANTTITTLYTLDAAGNRLFIQNPANSGAQTLGQTVTLSGNTLDFTAINGFDIPSGVNAPSLNAPATSGSAFAVLRVGGSVELYSINLVNAQATYIDKVGAGSPVQGLAVQSSLGGFSAIGLDAAAANLVRFNTLTPGATTTAALGPLTAGETLVGIDFRPQTGQLYGLGVNATADNATLYLLDPQNGGATAVGAASQIAFRDGAGNMIDLPAASTGYGFDFNPTVDRIRVTTSTGWNFRLNPNNGAGVDGDTTSAGVINPDGNINGNGSTGVSATAYTNSFGQSLTGGVTTQYTLDAASDRLFIQNPPNNGVQTSPLSITLGGGGLNFTNVGGFDIPASVRVTTSSTAASGLAYAALTVGGVSGLYSIDLSTGAATNLGFAGAAGLSGLALGDAPASLVSPTQSLTAFALSGTNLLSFDTANPALVQTTPITNTTAGETLVGIDIRPQNGLLYGLGVNATANNATLYLISTRTGFAGVVGTASGIQFTTDGAAFVDLPDPATVGYGFDFNPAADRLRVVAGSLNFRINPNTGAGVDGDNTGLTSGTVNGTNPDGATSVGATNVDAAAYTSNHANTTVTTLYTLDAGGNRLFIQNPANSGAQTLGQTVTLGGSTLDFTLVSGFDIPAGVNAPTSNAPVATGSALAVLNVGGVTGLYSIDLVNAQATFRGNIGAGATAVQGLAVQSSLSGFAAIGLDATAANLVRFNTSTLGTTTTVPVGPLASGETLVGIDFRPQTGQLYGLGVNATATNATLYLLDPQTGAASAVGTAGQIAFVDAGGAAIDLPAVSAGYGLDFNPTVDRIRVTSSTNLNFRVNPNNGAPVDGDTTTASLINTDGAINGNGSTGVSATAYTNSFGQSLTGGVTTQYTLDAASDRLFIQNPPNNGVQTTPLTVTLGGSALNFTDIGGFDIPAGVRVNASGTAASGVGFAALTVTGITGLYSIDLTTGVAVNMGTVEGAAGLSGFTLGDRPAATVSAPQVLSVTPNGNLPALAGNQRSSVVSVQVVFNQPVQLDPGALTLALHGNNVVFAGVAGPFGSLPTDLILATTDNITWVVTFSGNTDLAGNGLNSLKDGVYNFNIDATKVHPLGLPGTNAAGNSRTVFHRLFGDINAPSTPAGGIPGVDFEAVVNTGDNLVFRTAFNNDAAYVPYLDFDGDGVIITGDNLQFRKRFNKALTWRV
jgi:hypothetical protein